ncbi:hypothetical protein N7481_003005 [Penicillium waksmanii]|uniref:uncharacterized protein n=1 Tax=Penicillium waksmanii TaxID=69791 RepID=UPI002549748D|nr:uncharacterized protein N7481_003005 [Penicillium waksmanii]KAJ5987795.1 hypothetical protein N7481_003005 [Penicillium waksmanii]
MALPPEQINIKRRREEEPVETLYIQSALHQTKRRFTDFVFQRVPLKASDLDNENENGNGNASASPHPAAQRLLRSPRSVSSLHVNRRANATPQPISSLASSSSSGVPTVRATSPGAEIRDAQRRAAAQKDADEKRKRTLRPDSLSNVQHTSSTAPTSPSPSNAAAAAAILPRVSRSAPGSGHVSTETSGAATPSSRAVSVRRFQISRTSSPALGLRGAGGVQKRRTEGSPGVAVLVEQLQRTQHSRKASMVANLVGESQTQAQFNDKGIVVDNALEDSVAAAPIKPRKRPVVNSAEKKWREERKTAVSAAKSHLEETLEKSARAKSAQSWDEESERLAREFEKVALELENDMEIDDGSHEDDSRVGAGAGAHPHASPARVPAPKPDYSRFASPAPSSTKYQPRLPKESRITAAQAQAPAQSTEKDTADTSAGANDDSQAVDDNDDDYVYDVYIRRPLAETDMLTNPLAELESDQQLKNLEASRAGVGVIVITAEDEEYWENFIEDDEEEWDSEDADSNAENNPANDYPEEELSSSDEDDDPSAIYSKYRRHGVSDDEEFDIDDSGSESGARFNSAFGGYRQRYGGHVDSDDESD